MRTVLAFLLRNYPNLKGRNSVALERDFRTSDLIPSGQQIGSRIAFAKIEDEEIQKQIDKLEAQSRQQGRKQDSRTGKEAIQFDDFAKMDMRVGTIIEASKMPKANKLLILK
jgi:methionyl-tRNA synthetase